MRLTRVINDTGGPASITGPNMAVLMDAGEFGWMDSDPGLYGCAHLVLDASGSTLLVRDNGKPWP
jgi:hypothetical protein